ncbi:MAG: acylphosphatase [Gammaproteobacteria bacterium]|nr:acylphosphatase [Gammaproteobacteria bacterium]
MQCRRFWVSGRVQGVCFRTSTRSRALHLGLSGWVRNLIDGRVEVFACGDQQPLTDFERWLNDGPELARVDSVIAIEMDYVKYDGFEIR